MAKSKWSNDRKASLFRNRFYGRQDIYAKQTTSQRDDGKVVRNFYPVCKKFWSSGCHIKLKDGVSCDDCEIKAYESVSNESVLKHIKGDEQHVYYVLQPDGMIKFGAIDFDFKPGKESKGYTFEDVKRVADLMDSWSIPHGIARSTGAGYHIYIFLDDEMYSSYKFRLLIWEIFEQVGFMEESRQGLRPIPEIFPKQTNAGLAGVGNGIKPPMIEVNFEKGRNCWVTKEDRTIPFANDGQWDYFEKVPEMNCSTLDKILKEREIEVNEEEEKKALAGEHIQSSGMSGLGLGNRPRGKWQPPLTGSMEKVTQGCSAFRSLMERCESGEAPGHQEGFALFHMAMSTADGLKIFQSKVPGWGEKGKDIKQLEHSVGKNYSPWTCKRMQEHGICSVGTKCFDKKPPYDTVEGKTVLRDDIPEAEWPDPSPIRYAFGKGEDFLVKLEMEADDLSKEDSPAKREQKLKELVYRAQVFDESQQAAYKDYLVKIKLGKKRELNKLFNEAGNQKTEELKDSAIRRADVQKVEEALYKKRYPFGYSVLKKLQGNKTVEISICSADITILEERVYVEEDSKPARMVYIGEVEYGSYKKTFEIDSDKWLDSTEFFKFFGKLCGAGFNVLKMNVDQIRQAAMAFSDNEEKRIKKTNIYVTQGWYGDTYLTPSVLIDKDGARANTDKPVDLSYKNNDIAAKLDFKLLSDSELKDTLFHIKKDLFNAFPRRVLFTSMAHTLGAGLIKPLNLNFHPTLWIEGDTGEGKSELLAFMQAFWGNFGKRLPNFRSTYMGMSILAKDFRDTLLTIDDYKGNSPQQVRTARDLVQYSYDGGARAAANRTGSLRESNATRCLLAVSGEASPTTEGSVIARLIWIEYKRAKSKLETKEVYYKCLDYRDHYRGITPAFLHWFLLQNRERINDDRLRFERILEEGVDGINNASRICQNLAVNHLAFNLFIRFMVDRGGIDDPKEADQYIQEHWNYTVENRDFIADKCDEERGGNVFLRTLEELLRTGKASIRHLRSFDHDRADEIGFVMNEDKEPTKAYLFPGVTLNLVTKYVNNLSLTRDQLARHFESNGILIKAGKSSEKQVSFDNRRPRVWEVHLHKLIQKDEPHLVHNQTQPLPINNLDPPTRDAEGLI